MNDKINFGIVGCGAAAITHARLLMEIPEARLLCVADKNYEAAKAFAAEYGVYACESYEAMLADESIDAVTVTTPSYFHKENAIAALDAGKNVVLEKPMALCSADCDEIIARIESSGKLLTVMSQLRFSDDILRIKKLIRDGAFGKISLVELVMKYYRNEEYYSDSNWRGTLKYDGGGALINQGIHGIDLIMYILGDILNVKAMKKTVVHDIEAEDTLVAALEFECGALGIVEASTCAYPGFDRVIRIHGESGYAVMRENVIEELMIGGEKIEIPASLSANKPFGATTNAVADVSYHKANVQNFVNALLGKEKLLVDCYDGKRAVSVIKKIYEDSQRC